MKFIKYLIVSLVIFSLSACTKLYQKLQSTVLYDPNANIATVSALLTGTYNDLNGLLHGQDQLFSLEENTGDMCLVPTRGGDWDDNGVWRVLHAHTWTATHAQPIAIYNELGKLESDAIATLAF